MEQEKPKRGRPKGIRPVTVKTFKLDSELCHALKAAADRDNRTQRDLVESGLKRELMQS